MKKEYWIAAVLLGVGFFLHGQSSFQSTVYGVKLKSLETLNSVCPASENDSGMGFQGMDEITTAAAERIVNKMLTEMGITNRYKLRECKKFARGNALAQAFMENGQVRKYIIYDVDFLKEIADATETNYAAMFVLAHEVGHHINDHTLNHSGSEVSIEIEADVFAGARLAINGANLEQTLRTPRSTTNIFTKPYASHPGRMDRMKAAFKGWMTYAQNDDMILAQNAAYIKEYNDEINAYQRQLNERNKPKKPVVAKEEVTTNEVIPKEKEEVKEQTDEPKKVVAQEEVTKKEVVASKEEVTKKPSIAKEENNVPPEEPEVKIVTKEEREQQGAADVLQKYFKALGGLTKVNSIKTMSFNELTDVDEGYQQFNFHYDQQSPTLLIITNNARGYEGEQYKISNDTIYFKYPKDKSWQDGIPPNEGRDPESFKRKIGSSTGNFLEDFTLFASPSLVALKEEVDFEGERCYRLQVKETFVETKKLRKGIEEQIFIKQNRYYRVSDGLLHAREDLRRIQQFKKGKPEARFDERTVTVHKDYKEVNGLQFPTAYQIVNSIIEDGEEYLIDFGGEITKKVSDIEVTFE